MMRIRSLVVAAALAVGVAGCVRAPSVSPLETTLDSLSWAEPGSAVVTHRKSVVSNQSQPELTVDVLAARELSAEERDDLARRVETASTGTKGTPSLVRVLVHEPRGSLVLSSLADDNAAMLAVWRDEVEGGAVESFETVVAGSQPRWQVRVPSGRAWEVAERLEAVASATEIGFVVDGGAVRLESRTSTPGTSGPSLVQAAHQRRAAVAAVAPILRQDGLSFELVSCDAVAAVRELAGVRAAGCDGVLAPKDATALVLYDAVQRAHVGRLPGVTLVSVRANGADPILDVTLDDPGAAQSVVATLTALGSVRRAVVQVPKASLRLDVDVTRPGAAAAAKAVADVVTAGATAVDATSTSLTLTVPDLEPATLEPVLRAAHPGVLDSPDPVAVHVLLARAGGGVTIQTRHQAVEGKPQVEQPWNGRRRVTDEQAKAVAELWESTR